MISLDRLTTTGLDSLSLTARVDTALCVGAGGSSGSLADKPIVRNAAGQLLIPASQLKGRLRHECEKLARGLGWAICQSPNAETMCPQRLGLTGHFQRDAYLVSQDPAETDETESAKHYHCLICQIFGNPALPARVLFDDLVCTEDLTTLPEVLRPGVTLNRTRRTAEDKRLYFLETSPANTALPFAGAIHFQADCPPWAKALLLAGLRQIHALGGSKSAGLGWLQWQIDDNDLAIEEGVWEFLAQGGKA